MNGPHPLPAALVGCGRIGAFTRQDLAARLGPNWWPLSHADAIAAIDELTLVAVCDRDRDAAGRATARFGGRAFDDVGELIEEARPVLLSVATRSDVRPGILKSAAAGGVRAIHTEKPLGLRLADCLAACDLLAQHGVAVSYGAVRRYMPVYREAQRQVASGAFGALRSIVVKFGRTGLMWNHPHSVDLICGYSGCDELVDVQATCELASDAVRGNLIDGDPLVLGATMRFANGVVGHIVAADGLTVELSCEAGTVAVVGDGAWLELRQHSLGRDADPDRDVCMLPDRSAVSGRVLAIGELVAALRRGAPLSLRIEDLMLQHRILFALAQSHLEGGRRLSLDNVDPDLMVTGRTNGRVA